MRPELQDRICALGPVVDGDVGNWRQYLVTVVLSVQLRVLTRLQTQIEAGHYRHDVPFELNQCVSFARTQGSETHNWMLQLSAVLVELGVDKTVVLERLQSTIRITTFYFLPRFRVSIFE